MQWSFGGSVHFHYLTFLLGVLCGIALVCLLIHLAYKLAMKTDEDVFRIQKSVDDYPEEHTNSRE